MNDVSFWSKVVKLPESCWIFLPGLRRFGYGSVARRGGSVNASRHSWVLEHGAVPIGQCVLHSCDTPPCVNPGHLFLGSHKDNAVDMITKGRRRIARAERETRMLSLCSQVATVLGVDAESLFPPREKVTVQIGMKRVQSRREDLGMLIPDLVDKSGVNARTIREIESGDWARTVQARVQRGLAKALGLKPIDLFTSEGLAR